MKVNHQGVVDFNYTYVYTTYSYGWAMKVLLCRKMELLCTHTPANAVYSYHTLCSMFCLYTLVRLINNLICFYHSMSSIPFCIYMKYCMKYGYLQKYCKCVTNQHTPLNFNSIQRFINFNRLILLKYTFTYLIRAAGFFANTYFLWIFFLMLFIARIS